MSILFRRARVEDWESIAALLTDSGLPLEGAQDHLGHFLLATREDGSLAGVAGMEVYGETGLLRSVAVVERGCGLGSELVRRVLDQGYADGLRQIALLTTTAADFFPVFGFRIVRRDDLPDVLAASAEFQGACPDTATAMLLDLKRPPVMVRRATPEDIPAITRIYNQGIEDRCTLETELRSEDERRIWLNNHGELHPVIVAVQGGQVRGWASLGAFSPRAAYRFVADLSIYVERACRGQGIGTRLMPDILRRARSLGYHKVVLATFPHLTGAVMLYQKFGFRHVGDYHEQGMLDGQWVDTRIMELVFEDTSLNPS